MADQEKMPGAVQRMRVHSLARHRRHPPVDAEAGPETMQGRSQVTYREQGWPAWTGQRQDSGHIGWIVSLRGQIAALEWEEATIMQSAGICNARW